MTIDQLHQLATASNDAQRQAAEVAKGAHQKALESAQGALAELSNATGEGERRDALQGIVEAAALARYKSAAGKQQAGLVTQQFAQLRADDNGTPASIGRDGPFLMRTSVSGTSSYSVEHREKVFAALVVAATAGADTGLLEIPSDWAGHMSLADLETYARVLDPKSLEQHEADHAATAAELVRVRRLVDALKQATPRLYALVEGDAGLEVTIRNHRGGALGMAGLKFEHGDTSLSSSEFDKLRGNSTFQAYLDQGTLEIISTSTLVEEL